MKTLAQQSAPAACKVRGPLDRPVTGISIIPPVSVQVFIKSVCRTRSHGKRYVQEALAAGAAAVVTDADDVAAGRL